MQSVSSSMTRHERGKPSSLVHAIPLTSSDLLPSLPRSLPLTGQTSLWARMGDSPNIASVGARIATVTGYRAAMVGLPIYRGKSQARAMRDRANENLVAVGCASGGRARYPARIGQALLARPFAGGRLGTTSRTCFSAEMNAPLHSHFSPVPRAIC